MKAVSFYMIHNLLYETKVTGVTKRLKAHVKIRSFSVCYCKYEQKKYIVSYKTSVSWICNTTLTGVMLLHYIYIYIFNFHKLLLSTNEVLYLQKQPLVGTLQKQLLLILTNIFAVL